jgi:cytochrome P450
MTSRERVVVDFDQHSPGYRERSAALSHELRAASPVTWTESHGGYWIVSGHRELCEFSRRPDVFSNDHDPEGVRNGWQGIQIPAVAPVRAGFLEMDPPEQLEYRRVLNPPLSPAAVAKWRPLLADVARACIDDVIEVGRLDFVDDLANVVPAVLTMAMLGLPLEDWVIYCEPTHAAVYTHPDSPEHPQVVQDQLRMVGRLAESIAACRAKPRPGIIKALIDADIDGQPLDDGGIVGTVFLVIGGGFDTTTALTANSLRWLSDHPVDRQALIDSPALINTATEEFLRFFSPSQGDARTVTQDCEINGYQFEAGDRILFSFGMCNRDPSVFVEPDALAIDRDVNRHAAFGLGTHRCIGSNVARMTYKAMLHEVLDRIPDFECVEEGTVRYESIGIINGYQHLPATFTPGERHGDSLADVMRRWEAVLYAEV